MIYLQLIRNKFLTDRTCGTLYRVYPDKTAYHDICFTLEDTVREPGVKIPGKTAIQAGKYDLVVDRSNRFSKIAGHDVYLPRLLNVPQFEGIRIHSGNTPLDSAGCVLVGMGWDERMNLRYSRSALEKLMFILKDVRMGSEKCQIEIIENREHQHKDNDK